MYVLESDSNSLPAVIEWLYLVLDYVRGSKDRRVVRDLTVELPSDGHALRFYGVVRPGYARVPRNHAE
jgi:hypothetical protein